MKENIEQLPLNQNVIADEVPVKISKKKLKFFIIKIIISTVLIYWILQNTNVSEILNAITSAKISYILIAYSLLFVGHFLSILRWRVLLQAQGFPATVFHLFKSYMVGIFFNNLLPSTIGGDTSRAYDSWKIGKSKGKAVTVIFVDRFFGLFALMIFALASLLISNQLTENLPFLYFWLILGSVLMGLISWMIFMPSNKLTEYMDILKIPFSKPIKILLHKVVKSFLSFQGNKKALSKALFLSILLQVNVVIHYYLIGEALSFNVALHNFFLIIPISIFLMMIPVSINGIGIRENAFAFFFAVVGGYKADAVALAWIAYGFVLIQGIIGGIIYAFRK